MSEHDDTAQKLIPCTCGGYGQDKRRHMTDCPRHAIAWEDIAAALASERAKFAALQEVFDKAQGFIDDKATWGQLVSAVETVEALRPATSALDAAKEQR